MSLWNIIKCNKIVILHINVKRALEDDIDNLF